MFLCQTTLKRFKLVAPFKNSKKCLSSKCSTSVKNAINYIIFYCFQAIVAVNTPVRNKLDLYVSYHSWTFDYFMLNLSDTPSDFKRSFM